MKITGEQFELLKATCVSVGSMLILAVLYTSYKMDNLQEKKENTKYNKKENKIFDQSLYQSFQKASENDEYLEKNILDSCKEFENNYSPEKIESSFDMDSFLDDLNQISSKEIQKENIVFEEKNENMNIEEKVEKIEKSALSLEESFLRQMNESFAKFEKRN